MKHLLYITIALLSACSNAQTSGDVVVESTPAAVLPWVDAERGIKVDSLETGLQFDKSGSYGSAKSRMNALRDAWAKQLLSAQDSVDRNALLDSAGVVFTQQLLNTIVPYWYGTEWDFNGYTAVPNDGQIACGYFVSTTMKDMGLNLDRYSQAQQTPRNEAKTIACDTLNVRYIRYDQIFQSMKALKEGLYFIGLENHVGYIYTTKGRTFFIHSNYIDGHVVIEDVETSRAFGGRDFYIADITHNRLLMKHWLTKQPVTVRKS